MQTWWNWLIGLALVSLLFIAIPINYSGSQTQQKLQAKFDKYIEKFNKTYKNNATEYETRFQHFMVNYQEIDKLNGESRGPVESRAKYGLTKLSDMSKVEFTNLHLSDEKQLKPPRHFNRSWDHHDKLLRDSGETMKLSEPVYSRKKRMLLPMQVDWRTKGVISKVRNQGLCGACWAFSTVGAMEAMAAITTGKLDVLSVQEVIDCAGLGNAGCAGGDICLLLQWLLATKTPVEKDSDYPLRLNDGACRLKKNVTGVKLKSFTCDSFVGSENQILQAIALHGPVAVAVNALTWQNYLGGVIQFNCGGDAKDLNHAVELVGYDLSATVPYYIAKNSWGSEFGVNGYIHLAVGTNMCGLANEVATVDVY